jgi:uncharacterized protein (TIGR00725 family)
MVHIGVVGGGTGPPSVLQLAEEVRRRIASAGGVLVCGGLGGVMEASARGAREVGGLTVGILPGDDAGQANPFIDVRIVTDLGHARNVVVVRSSNAMIALPGEHGTLSEVALALKIGVPVIGLGGWSHLDGVVTAATPEEAVSRALAMARREHVPVR